MYHNKNVAVVIPAYNEEESIALVVDDIRQLKNKNGQPLVDDIVVCNNASTDNTAIEAHKAGARLTFESQLGYGRACLSAIDALNQPDIVVFVDADRSVNVHELPQLLDPLLKSADLVIGSRTMGQSMRGALTLPQKFGNWLASLTIRLIWHTPITDLGPFRAICYRSLGQLQMQDQTFGWTVEMQVKAIQLGLVVAEVPVSSLQRIGQSKISGTVKGVIGAALGIFGMIFKLRRQEKRLIAGYRNNL